MVQEARPDNASLHPEAKSWPASTGRVKLHYSITRERRFSQDFERTPACVLINSDGTRLRWGRTRCPQTWNHQKAASEQS
jgi:hypothetical protein